MMDRKLSIEECINLRRKFYANPLHIYWFEDTEEALRAESKSSIEAEESYVRRWRAFLHDYYAKHPHAFENREHERQFRNAKLDQRYLKEFIYWFRKRLVDRGENTLEDLENDLRGEEIDLGELDIPLLSTGLFVKVHMENGSKFSASSRRRSEPYSLEEALGTRINLESNSLPMTTLFPTETGDLSTSWFTNPRRDQIVLRSERMTSR